MKNNFFKNFILAVSSVALTVFGFAGTSFAHSCSPSPSGNGSGCYTYCADGGNQPVVRNSAANTVSTASFRDGSGNWAVAPQNGLSQGVYYIGDSGSTGGSHIFGGGYGCYSPSISLNLSNNNPSYNTPVTVSWSSQGVSSCTVNGGGNSWSGTSGSQSSGNLTQTTTFTLSCSGSAGSPSQSQTATISSPPMVSLSASPSLINLGDSSTLSWTISGATSCTQSSTLGNWTLSSPSSGSMTLNNIQSAQSFSLTCTNSNGNSSASASINVKTNLYANPYRLTYGGSTFLNWISAFGNTCTVSGGGLNITASSTGSYFKYNLTRNTKFSISCTDTNGFNSTSFMNVGITPRFSCQS